MLDFEASSDELNPWLVVLGDSADTSLALWRIDEKQLMALALFSSQPLAQQYASNHCQEPFRVEQFDTAQLVRILIRCHQSGIRYAALDPTDRDAPRLFIVSQVLRSVKEQLVSQRKQ